MINYEVNLEIEQSIIDTFLKWLPTHIQELLQLNGFKKANVFYDDSPGGDYKIIVVYTIDSIENLQNYFDNHATLMQQKTKEIFFDKFKASRRILKLMQSY